MRKKIVTIATLLSSITSLQAQTDDAMTLGVRNLSLCYEDAVYGSARYSAMAGARMALGEDISSTRENPAGLGLYMKNSDVNVTPDFSLGGGDNNFSVSSFGGAFIIGNNHKANGFVSSAIGVTYHRVRNYEGSIDFNGGCFNEGKSTALWSASYGMNIGNRKFFGLGLDIVRGHYLQKTKEGNSTISSFDSETRGWNIKAGTIIKLAENFNIAAAFHSPTRYNIEESTIFNDEVGYDDAQYHQWGPLKLEVGAAWYIKPTTTLSLDYSYQDFKAINVANSYDYFNDVKHFVEDNMKSCHTIKLGFEMKPTENISARLGASYVTSPTGEPKADELKEREIKYAVLLPKGTFYGCAGAGYQYKWAYADLAYVLKSQKADLYPSVNETSQCSNKTRITHDLLLTIGAHF